MRPWIPALCLVAACAKAPESDTDVAETDAETEETDEAADTDDAADTDETDDTDADTDVPEDADADGYTVATGDCDDTDGAIHPGADERCNDRDDDCDGKTDDEDDDVVDGTAAYADADGDGYGDPASGRAICDTAGAVTDGTDCDDVRSDVYPGAAEICGDGAVNDCDATYADAAAACGGLDLGGAVAEYTGVAFNDQSGRSARAVGDVDGDGVTDFLIGAPHTDLSTGRTEPGEAYLVHGGGTGTISLSAAAADLLGEEPYDSAGQAVAPAGDADGDGLADLLVGAPGKDRSDVQCGAVYLLLGGPSGTVDLGTADAILYGSGSNSAAGGALDGGRDVSGDGSPDFIAGAWGASSYLGAAYVYTTTPSGASNLKDTADAVLRGYTTTGYAGQSVALVADYTGDGIDDVAVGAFGDSTTPSYAGATYLVEGGAGLGDMSLADADATWIGEVGYDYSGWSVDSAGDFDGDGLGDLVIGATGAAASAGAAYVVPGGVLGDQSLADATAELTGEALTDAAGMSVSEAGDVDGDGLGDVLVGANGHAGTAKGAGAVYVVPGGTTGVVSLGTTARIDGLASTNYLGSSVDTAGDLDGDGAPDFVLGAHGRSAAATLAGSTYILLAPEI